jgi:hypothetical protein
MNIHPVPGRVLFKVSDDFKLPRGYRYDGDDQIFCIQGAAALDMLGDLAGAIAECDGREMAAMQLKELAAGFEEPGPWHATSADDDPRRCKDCGEPLEMNYHDADGNRAHQPL